MKILLFLLLSISAQASNYYVASAGRDYNPGSQASPWHSIQKVNSSVVAGDSVFYNRGDVFPGCAIPTAGVYYGAYGLGANPQISGFNSVCSWVNIGGNIWESSGPVSTLPLVNEVSINGVNTPMGRYPNSGYLQYQSFSTNTSITASGLTGSWVGAEIVAKKTKWILDRMLITAQTGTTLTYTAGTGLPYTGGTAYNGAANYGFFIQNDLRTLDSTNEWYYNPSNKKLYLYSTTAPGTVQVSAIDTLVNIQGKNNITFDHVDVIGANSYGFYVANSQYVTIQNNVIDFCFNSILGNNVGGNSRNFLLQNSFTNHSNNFGPNLQWEFSNDTIRYNVVRNSGMLPGMGGSSDGKYQGINVTGTGSYVFGNEVDSTGYNAIGYRLHDINIYNNYVHNFCLVKDDGGGIYTQGVGSNNFILNNIVVNGPGNFQGTPNGFPGGNQASSCNGIYLDDATSGLIVKGNTVENVGMAGIFLHDVNNVQILNNMGYLCGKSPFFISDNATGLVLRHGITSQGNTWFQNTGICMTISTKYNDIDSLGSFANNYYLRPLDDNLTIDLDSLGAGSNHYLYSLPAFQALTGLDQGSKRSPKAAVTASDIYFGYNATFSPVTIPLGYNYIDAAGLMYNGAIIIQPYSSVVLIKNGPMIGCPSCQ
jgi:parallel beta-helix repeat protein